MNTRSTIVPAGEIRRSQRHLFSFRFAYCSAVVVDYGVEAIFAHAVPGNSVSSPQNDICADNVTDRLISALEEQGIPHNTSKAYINAGSQQDLELISRQMSNAGIEIIVANTNLAPPMETFPSSSEPTRNVSYDPIIKKLNVIPLN